MYEKQLEIAIKAIREAGKAVLEIYNGHYDVEIKDDNSPVTTADLVADKMIREILLSGEYKDYGILTEESAADNSRLSKDYCWLVDPVDGTKDFVNRTDNFSINIALCYKHEIVVGLIFVPIRNILYYAIKNQGAFKVNPDGSEERIHVSENPEKYRLVISQFFYKANPKIDNDEKIASKVPVGSSYKAGVIAEGKAELAVKFDNHTKEWDTAPSAVIIPEAGGVILDAYGDKMYYNKEDVVNQKGWIIASNMEIFNRYKIEK